jgi:hypothetical protein
MHVIALRWDTFATRTPRTRLHGLRVKDAAEMSMGCARGPVEGCTEQEATAPLTLAVDHSRLDQLVLLAHRFPL